MASEIGIVVPALVHEFEAAPPAHLAEQWRKHWDLWSFHSPDWWRRHWTKTGLVDVETADLIQDGWRYWVAWDEATLELGFVPKRFAAFVPEWLAMMRTDAGENLAFARMLARRLTP
ncbi:MAG: hypothetical protein ABR583_06020 [Gaiellaceae bacterium]